ncbi:MAG: cell division protein ZapA [Chitinophagaceae bacterium]
METLIAATVVIGDRNYRIKMNPQDEEVVRRTVKTINEKILEYKTHFAGKDMQDYIAMVLIWLATEQAQQQPGLPEGWFEQLEGIEQDIDNQLNK